MPRRHGLAPGIGVPSVARARCWSGSRRAWLWGASAAAGTIGERWLHGVGETEAAAGAPVRPASAFDAAVAAAWFSLAGRLVQQEQGAPLDRAAEAYARVGMAVADAFISCGSCKYRYNLLRPVTYIQRLTDPRWLPMLPTPPFPEYASGHSVQAAAAAQVLTDLFGARAFTDRTHVDRGFAPRTFASFVQAAEEAAISRRYGGIHFRPAIERGLEQGRCIGRKASALRFRT